MKLNFARISIAVGLAFAAGSAHAAVTGQWDFNSSNLTATVGTDLAYFGDLTTTEFSTVSIGGTNAVVMQIPAATPTQGFIMTHNIAPNGGGAYVNQYTLIMDIMYPAASSGVYRSLFQTSSANGNDGDLFINSDNAIGISFDYKGVISPDTWHRVAFVVDLTLPSGRLKKFIDGIMVGAQDLDNLDGRWSLDPTALLFADEDNETAIGYVNSIQVHDTPLSAGDIFALGKATAAGIPATIPQLQNLEVTVTPTGVTNIAGMTGNHFTATAIGTGTLTYEWRRNGTAVAGQTAATLRFTNLKTTDAGTYTLVVANGLNSVTSAPVTLVVEPTPPTRVTGQWDFNQGDLRATIGQPLEFFNPDIQSQAQFGTTTTFGISDINGQPTSVLQLNPTATSGAWGGLKMTHGIAPNGGGTNVNQYTVIMDVLYPAWTSGSYRALWQTDVTCTNDADLFLNGGNGIGISSIYNGEIGLDSWQRIVFTIDTTKRELGKYFNGTNVLSTAVGAAPLGPNDVQYLSTNTNITSSGRVDHRWSLGPQALLFADDDTEVTPVYVSSIQVRSGRMTDAEIAALGMPTAAKLPSLAKGTLTGNNLSIEWTGTALESATSLQGPWTVVTGAAHPYVVAAPTGTRYFRVRQ